MAKAGKKKKAGRSATCWGAVPSTKKYKAKVKCSKRVTVRAHKACKPHMAALNGRCKPGGQISVREYTRCPPKPGRGVRRGKRACTSLAPR